MTLSDIKNKIYGLTKSNSEDYDATTLLININNAYERAVSVIQSADGMWQWDDSNNADLPNATTNLVSGQNKYTLSVDHLRITDVEYKDQSGDWHVLKPIDQKDVSNTDYALSEYATETGDPLYYDKYGANIVLYPKPDYSQADSLKIYYQRGPNTFSAAELTEGSATPGINSLYHDVIAYWAAYEYALANSNQNANGLLQEALRREEQMRKDYSKRDRDGNIKLTMKGINHR